MKILKLPDPPHPDDYRFKNNDALYRREMYQWQSALKGRIELASTINNTPLGQAFVTGTTSHVLTTFIAATSTGQDITNFIVSLVNAMQQKGIVKAVDTST